MKHTSILIILLTAALLVSCGGEKKKRAEDGASASKVQTSAPAAKTGAYSSYEKPTPEEMNMFIALTHDMNPRPKALKVAKQVVNGINYRFQCVGQNGDKREMMIVEIFKALPTEGGEAKLVSSKVIKSGGLRHRKQEVDPQPKQAAAQQEK